jgi:dTMP kinase
VRARGVLIVLEGIDGSGKTTLAGGLARAIEASSRRVVVTKEPTDGPIGRQIRELARKGRDSVSADEEFELFHRDRIEHVNSLVRPSLAAGAVVIQDRSYFSSYAYQGERGVDRARILSLSEAIAPRPDVLLVVDVPAEVALERIKKTRGVAGADDFETIESLRRIRQVFLDLPEAVILDGTARTEDVLLRAMSVVSQKLGLDLG